MSMLLDRAMARQPDKPTRFVLFFQLEWHGTMVVRWAKVLRSSPWWRHPKRWREVNYRGIAGMMQDSGVFAEYESYFATRGWELNEVLPDKCAPCEARLFLDEQQRLAQLGYLPDDEVIIPVMLRLIFTPIGTGGQE